MTPLTATAIGVIAATIVLAWPGANNLRLVARVTVWLAGVVLRPRRAEFAGELAHLHSTQADSGLRFAAGTLIGATVERTTSLGRPLRIESIEKSFGSTMAVRGVSFEVLPGSITALVGGSGAGKSTLINVLAGAHRSDRGAVYFGDLELTSAHGRDGIAFVRHVDRLAENLTVAENLTCAFNNAGWFLTARTEARRATELLDMLGVNIDPHTPVSRLTPFEYETVQLLRAVSADPELLVLDEPAAALTQDAAVRFFAMLDRLRSYGIGILFVSHRIDDVMAVADKVAVMRDGEIVLDTDVHDTTAEEIVREILGHAEPERTTLSR